MSESNQRGGQRRRKYPFLDLEQAIDRARSLYAAERRNPVPVEVALRHWGYGSAKSGIATTTLSAVKQFGLIDEQGSGSNRLVSLSDSAYAILNAPEHVRREEIKRAAMQPPIHEAVWKHYGPDTGSEAGFRWFLLNELGFSERGASEFSKQYHRTIRFAGLTDAAETVSGVDGPAETTAGPMREAEAHLASGPTQEDLAIPADQGGADEPQVNGWFAGEPVADLVSPGRHHAGSTVTKTGGMATRHAIPLVGGKQVVLEGEFPLTEAAWNGFLSVLEAFKPGLVQD